MARKGKRERVIAARQSIITANQQFLDAEQAKPPPKSKGVGPAGYKTASTDHRTALKGRNGGVGFNGPRGFKSPVYAVSKREQTPGMLHPGDNTRPMFGANASKRFAEDDYPTDKPSDTILMKHPPKRPRWRKV